jgi:hypothetical protein
MGKGRTVALIVAFVLLISLVGGCGGSSNSANAKAAARTAAQAKAARVKVAAARKRLAAAQLRVARQRRALAAAIRRRHQHALAAATSTTTTTTAPKVAPPKPTPRPGAPSTSTTTPVRTVARDIVAIQHTIDTMNEAFAKGVANGIAASEAANYYISAGVYTAGQCSAFEAARGLGVVSDQLLVHSGSVAPTPGWVDPVLRAVPGGRIYSLSMADVQTLVGTQQHRIQSVSTHATVQPNGRALLFLRCK